MPPKALALLGTVAALGAACAKPEPIYRWGNYEALVYESYANPGAIDPVTGAQLLAQDIERTSAEGKRVPPGVHAYLGYLYYSQGNLDFAREQFVLEKRLYPESTTFMDGILDKMASKQP